MGLIKTVMPFAVMCLGTRNRNVTEGPVCVLPYLRKKFILRSILCKLAHPQKILLFTLSLLPSYLQSNVFNRNLKENWNTPLVGISSILILDLYINT